MIKSFKTKGLADLWSTGTTAKIDAKMHKWERHPDAGGCLRFSCEWRCLTSALGERSARRAG